jgi:large subunit ribosomal protein L25
VEIPELKLGADHDVAVVVARHGRVEEEVAEGEEGAAEAPAKAVGADAEDTAEGDDK